MSAIGVLGAGTWGMALARMLCVSGHNVTVWSALKSEIEEYSKTRKHKNLPGMVIPDEINFTGNIEEACSGKDIILFAVPSIYVRQTARAAKDYIKPPQVIVDVAKGIEPGTLFTMTQVIKDELQNGTEPAALSGPTHAEEVALDLPAAIVSACADLSIARYVQEIFSNTCMRVYTNPDTLGVELCGAMKNIIALAAGISQGLGYGDNLRAALLTRGISEITGLGMAMGCMPETFAGLAGIGDLIVTATSMHSRNNRCGYMIGQGKEPAEAIKEVGMVVEGINALPAAIELKNRYKVELPIIEAVNRIINEKEDPRAAVQRLMTRAKKTELITTAQRTGAGTLENQ